MTVDVYNLVWKQPRNRRRILDAGRRIEQTMAESKQQRLDQIKADILKQDICPDLALAATNLVFGDGNPNADIVIIGEAPGRQEDEQGLPFVGASGKFLTEMLASINMRREQVYITNIVKYRPPNNRDPLPDEKAAFLPFLERQLDVIEPLMVVTLGRHSMNCFLPGLVISEVHGQPKRIAMKRGGSGVDAAHGAGEQRTETYEKYVEGVAETATKRGATSKSGVSGSAGEQALVTRVILPLYHPAAALYNGGLRQTLVEDFQNIPEILQLIRKEM